MQTWFLLVVRASFRAFSDFRHLIRSQFCLEHKNLSNFIAFFSVSKPTATPGHMLNSTLWMKLAWTRAFGGLTDPVRRRSYECDDARHKGLMHFWWELKNSTIVLQDRQRTTARATAVITLPICIPRIGIMYCASNLFSRSTMIAVTM